ncbi:hypothetical protein TWF694_007064 [Orbilia ellipsospora]
MTCKLSFFHATKSPMLCRSLRSNSTSWQPVCRKPLISSPIFRQLHSPTGPQITRSFLSTPRPDVIPEKEIDEARTWLTDFKKHRASRLPRGIGEVTFSRSPGPGGQNVNKSNTKATLRVTFDKLKPYVHDIFIRGLKQNFPSLLADNGNEILITSTKTRSQRNNTDDCWDKLYTLILQAAKIPGETSWLQKNRVKRL